MADDIEDTKKELHEEVDKELDTLAEQEKERKEKADAEKWLDDYAKRRDEESDNQAQVGDVGTL